MSFNLSFFSQSRSNQRIRELQEANQLAASEIHILTELNKTSRSRMTVLEHQVAELEKTIKNLKNITTITISNPSKVIYNTQDLVMTSNTDDFLDLSGSQSTMADDTSVYSSSSWNPNSSDMSYMNSSACCGGSCGCE